jgi:hypothetical protein
MKYIFLIISYFILPVFSLKKITPKVCINCKFFINSITSDNAHGKCSLFPREEENNVNFLVTGIKEEDYNYCCIARRFDDMCGEEGKKYKKKNLYKKTM